MRLIHGLVIWDLEIGDTRIKVVGICGILWMF